MRFVGAAANNAFRSYKSRVMICDEIDDENWRDTSDTGEGAGATLNTPGAYGGGGGV